MNDSIAGDKPPVSAILKLAEQAGNTLLEMRANITISDKRDGSKVTSADIACNELIVGELEKLTPDIPIIAEENPAAENCKVIEAGEIFWTVDPLDVTANYIAGRPDYSVNIALVKNGIPILGVLHFPAHEETYFTGDDGVAYCQKGNEPPQALQVMTVDAVRNQPVSAINPFVIAVRQREESHMKDYKQPFIQPVISAGQRRACMVAAGEVLMASEAAGFRIWDSAPAFAIVRAAGGDMRREDGGQLSFTSLQLPAYTVAHPGLLDKVYPPADNN